MITYRILASRKDSSTNIFEMLFQSVQCLLAPTEWTHWDIIKFGITPPTLEIIVKFSHNLLTLTTQRHTSTQSRLRYEKMKTETLNPARPRNQVEAELSFHVVKSPTVVKGNGFGQSRWFNMGETYETPYP